MYPIAFTKSGDGNKLLSVDQWGDTKWTTMSHAFFRCSNVRVLAKRSLYAHCRDILQKIRKIAYKYDKFLVILEVLFWRIIGYSV